MGTHGHGHDHQDGHAHSHSVSADADRRWKFYQFMAARDTKTEGVTAALKPASTVEA